MKYNLLKMVQLILESMDSDEVNSINDTVESRQVVSCIETTYNHLISVIDFPEHWDMVELEPSNDVTRPTLMYLPENVARIEWIQYDCTDDGETTRNTAEIKPLHRSEFFLRQNMLDTDETTVYSYNYLVDAETFEVRGRNDAWPQYYTLIGDRTLIFDNFKVDVSTTLTANRSVCYGMKVPVFTRADTFTPDLDSRNFSLLFEESKALAFSDIKQVPNGKAEQRARRALVHAGRTKKRLDLGTALDCAPAYGRR